MNKYLIIPVAFAFGAALALSCQTQSQKEPAKTAIAKDSSITASAKPVESGYAPVNGLKLYYEVYGQGKPLVLIHGAFMTIPLNWANVIPLFAKDRKVIVAEMQGHGRTRDTDRPFAYEAMADDISELLKHLKIDSADILGYSMGGGVAFQTAIRHPQQVRRLMVLSGTYAHDGWWPDVEAMYPQITADAFKGSPIEKQHDSLGNDMTKFPAFVKKVMSVDLKPYDWTKDAKSIKAPMFIAIGDADGVRYEHALELFRAKGGGKMGDIYGLPKSRLAIVPGTTHVGMMQHMNWLAPMITDFLDSDLNTAPPSF
ncbi:alpha/beta hydrolase [Pseudoflavitalea sp. G-6-1-2]|uniref:alpha/beta fold hydrolase n=1 Tax=Pseudoflavitalea sp. G-6-1-2 TaxID=2728841 RepID=UPI00146F501B|nr:alpha/beta hydrolase [Pseudoflavitalea sp. G-6-1-2]NML21395.1 alpha/beta hydrolase [Pseudoflavitalea sp. G-6-1-2]